MDITINVSLIVKSLRTKDEEERGRFLHLSLSLSLTHALTGVRSRNLAQSLSSVEGRESVGRAVKKCVKKGRLDIPTLRQRVLLFSMP